MLHIGSFPDDWQVWLTAAGVKGVDSSRGVSFDFPLAAYQAAMDGLGVALGRHALVAPDLKAGRLVVPFEFKMSTELAYYLVYPPEAIRRRKIKAFRDWIISLAEVSSSSRLSSAATRLDHRIAGHRPAMIIGGLTVRASSLESSLRWPTGSQVRTIICIYK